MSEHSSTLAVLLKRLEVATSRIEELALTKTKTAKVSHNEFFASDQVASSTTLDEPTFLKEYDTLVVPSLNKYLELSVVIGDVVLEQSKLVKELLLTHQKKFLQMAAKSKKPTGDQLEKIFRPSQDAVKAIVSHVEANRPSKLFNHLSMVSSGIPAVSWVIVEPETATCVKELTDSAQFFAYKVIKAFKERDQTHVEWANAFVTMLNQLHAYVKQYHKTGLTWNSQGQDASSYNENAASQKPGSPRPPPPPKPTNLRSAAEPVNPGSVFSEINKGDAVTAGLKKVDKSEMTHKNPTLRREADTSVTPPARSSARPSHKLGKEHDTSKPTKDPEVTLEGHKWLVQYHTGGNVVVEPTELKQIVYVFNCTSTTIQVKGKCNGVVLDSSKKSGVVLDTAMASVDVINSQSCQIQIMQSTPTIVVDKTDGLQLYLSKDCLDVEILTAKSSQVNVLLPSDDDDFSEKAISEQFKTTIVDGKVVTVPMEHE